MLRMLRMLHQIERGVFHTGAPARARACSVRTPLSDSVTSVTSTIVAVPYGGFHVTPGGVTSAYMLHPPRHHKHLVTWYRIATMATEANPDGIERFVEHPDPDRFFIQIEPAEIEMDVHDHDDVTLKTQLVPGGSFCVELTARFEYAGRDCSQHVSLDREAAESLYERLGECLEEDPRR